MAYNQIGTAGLSAPTQPYQKADRAQPFQQRRAAQIGSQQGGVQGNSIRARAGTLQPARPAQPISRRNPFMNRRRRAQAALKKYEDKQRMLPTAPQRPIGDSIQPVAPQPEYPVLDRAPVFQPKPVSPFRRPVMSQQDRRLTNRRQRQLARRPVFDKTPPRYGGTYSLGQPMVDYGERTYGQG